MSQKTEKPTLSGQRIKTRKRDEREKNDPFGFRDAILLGLIESGNNLDAVSKFLEAASSRLDYRRYGEVLFDILIAGGILAPGGTVITDGELEGKVCRAETCVFAAAKDLETIRAFTQVFMKLIRRYKYLEKQLEDEMLKVLMFLKGFGEVERQRLALLTAVLMANGQLPASVLTALFQEHLIKDGLALAFVIQVFETWIKEKDVSNLTGALKRAGLESKLLDFLPANKRTSEALERAFREKGLGQIVEFHRAYENAGVKKELQKQLGTMLNNGENVNDMIAAVKEHLTNHDMVEQEAVVLVWASLMASVEWNKKEELVAEQALKHLKTYTPLLANFSSQPKSEAALIIRVQEFCFDNMAFMKVFQKIILLFYKSEVLGEDTILRWYREAHSPKGKSVFLEQMKKFVDWLQNAEEESESGGEND